MSPSLNRAMLLAREKGASSWLIALPIDESEFALHKSASRDALSLLLDTVGLHYSLRHSVDVA